MTKMLKYFHPYEFKWYFGSIKKTPNTCHVKGNYISNMLYKIIMTEQFNFYKKIYNNLMCICEIHLLSTLYWPTCIKVE